MVLYSAAQYAPVRSVCNGAYQYSVAFSYSTRTFLSSFYPAATEKLSPAFVLFFPFSNWTVYRFIEKKKKKKKNLNHLGQQSEAEGVCRWPH